jgi:precorrin-3B C17-methyltransferase
LAAAGRKVAVVSGGDPGVFAMAAAVFEAVESGDPAWGSLDIRVEPGVTAMLAAAAEVGAPLGGDFCAISLSDNLKSWATIERRLRAAAEADFVIALYNPASKARPHQLGEAFACCARSRRRDAGAVRARRRQRRGEVVATTLADADPAQADMRTLVIVGASTTRRVGAGSTRRAEPGREARRRTLLASVTTWPAACAGARS